LSGPLGNKNTGKIEAGEDPSKKGPLCVMAALRANFPLSCVTFSADLDCRHVIVIRPDRRHGKGSSIRPPGGLNYGLAGSKRRPCGVDRFLFLPLSVLALSLTALPPFTDHP